MSCEIVSTFKGVSHFGEAQFINQLEANFKSYLDWAILKIGGWDNVDIPQSGAFGGDFSVLRPSNDPSYAAGKVWEGVRKDWVYETGVNYENNGTIYNPTPVTGVIINGTPYSTGFYVNYPLGQVVLTNPVSVQSTVKVAHSYRNVQVYIADSAPWWDEIQENSYRVDNSQFLTRASGNWSILAQHRVQLPAIVVEAIPRSRSIGAEIGNGLLDVYQDINIHVIAEDRFTRNNILDWIRVEQKRAIYLLDFNRMFNETGYPLDYRGSPNSGFKIYQDLIKSSGDGGFRWKKCFIDTVNLGEMDSISPKLHLGTARITVNVNL